MSSSTLVIDTASVQKDTFSCINHKYFVSSLVLGVVLAVGGFFICLAANQYLPCGVNAISQLGSGGWCLGFIPMIFGLLLAGAALPELIKLNDHTKKS